MSAPEATTLDVPLPPGTSQEFVEAFAIRAAQRGDADLAAEVLAGAPPERDEGVKSREVV